MIGRNKSYRSYSFHMRALRHSLLISISLLFAGAIYADTKTPVQDRIRREAQAFDLADVRLLDGPFKKAMMLDAEYLLRLEPDRLLSWFRKEAGLKPKGEVYGGWEAQGVAGHSLGHYLSACAMMFASTGDARFRERVNYIVNELELCQRENGNGYVAAIPNGKKIFRKWLRATFARKALTSTVVGFPGTRFTNSSPVCWTSINTCRTQKLWPSPSSWPTGLTLLLAKLTEEQFQRMLACEHGGMNEVAGRTLCAHRERKVSKTLATFPSQSRARAAGPARRSPARAARQHADSEIDRTRTALRTDGGCGGQDCGRVFLGPRCSSSLLRQRGQ